MRALVPLVVVALVGVARPAAAQFISPGDLTEGHKSMGGDDQCSSCHKEGQKVDSARCLRCHETLAKRVSAGRGLHGRGYKGKACESCHVEHNGRTYKLVRWPGGAMDKLDHAETGWTLEGDHATTTCLKCHTRKNSLGKPTFLGIEPACAGCHKDEHKGRFGTACQTCHGTVDWKISRLKDFDHSLARFALRGKHVEVECGKCHEGSPPRWKEIPFDGCVRCHEDPHKGKFKQSCQTCHSETGWGEVAGTFRKHHPGVSIGGGHRKVGCKDCHDVGTEKAPSKGDDCVDCHKPVHQARFGNTCERCHAGIKWLGLSRDIGLAAHDKTQYPLTGQHVMTACDRCHPTSKPPAQRYRKLVFDRCAACHKDSHKGEFAAQGGGECAACHGTAGFAPTSFGVTAHLTTRFALEGRHQGVACARCHPGSRPRTDLRVAKQACADCHANPHGEQFAKEMARGGCGSCHTPVGWDAAKIDHSTWPLTGSHARTACARCHGAVGQADKGSKGHKGNNGVQRRIEAAAYRGIPRDCEGCHEDLHAGQFRASEPVRPCTACHTTERFTLPGFDHEKTTGYRLDGKHTPLKCTKCHPSEELASGARAVRYRLGFRKCKDCHANPHREETP